MTKKDKKDLRDMLQGFESVLEEFDNTAEPNNDLINRLMTMDAGLSMASFEMIEA